MQISLFSNLILIINIFVRDILKIMTQPVRQYRLWHDYLQAWTNASFIRNKHLHSTHYEGNLLIVAMDFRIYEIKLFSILAAELHRSGMIPHVLLGNRRKQYWQKRYFKIYGVKNFIYWDEIAKKDFDHTLYDHFLHDNMSFNSVKEWKHDGCWIGPQILSSISRSNHIGAPDIRSPDLREQLKARLKDTIQRIPVAKTVLDLVCPVKVLLSEANYAKYAPLTDLAVNSDIDVIQVIQTTRDDALTMRRLNKSTRRQHPSSVDKENFNKIKKEKLSTQAEQELDDIIADRYHGRWFIQSRNQPDVNELSRNDAFKYLDLVDNRELGVIFSHVLWDANLFYGKDLFEDYGEWFAETAKAVCLNTNLNWLIKMHPANLWKRQRDAVTKEYSEVKLIEEHIGKLPDHVKLIYPDTKISTMTLLEIANYAITVRGTISTEAPCLGVTTLTAGTGRCDKFGFTVDSDSREEYLDKLSNITDHPKITDNQIKLARKHAYLAFCERPWVMKSCRTKFDKSPKKHALEANLFLSAKSWAEIDRNGDLNMWRNWAFDDKEVDFLSKNYKRK